jgi:hypothetical protein
MVSIGLRALANSAYHHFGVSHFRFQRGSMAASDTRPMGVLPTKLPRLEAWVEGDPDLEPG